MTINGSMTKYSVIIPTLNEAGSISRCLRSIPSDAGKVEVIVVDGGSKDETVQIARNMGAKVMRSQAGRGIQCNLGAANAAGSILLFLHADTRLPDNAFDIIESYFSKDEVQIGSFRLSFDEDHWLLKFYTWFTQFDFIFSRFGDQCIVVRRFLFDSIGAFPEWRLFEDVDFLRRARRLTKIHSFPARVETSARRFIRNGIARQQLRNGWYILLYLLGVDRNRIAEKYDRMRGKAKSTALLLFARYPRQGKVKTRLASSIGDEQATKFYRICLERIFSECRKICDTTNICLFYADENDEVAFRKWIGPDFILLPQMGANLGERITNAFKAVFRKGAKKAIIVGTDVPDLSADLIKQAEQALDSHDLVVGPSPDGGYYLLGMKSMHKKLFRDIPWSTETVFEETMDRIMKLELSVEPLPALPDIDTEEDLMRWFDGNGKADPHPVVDFVEKLGTVPLPKKTTNIGETR